MLMLPPVAARGKTAKSDPIYGNRPVNALANHIVKHAKSEPRKDIQRKTKKVYFLFYVTQLIE